MTIQAQIIQELKEEVAALHDYQKKLLKERTSPGVRHSLKSVKKSIRQYENDILWLPDLTNKAALFLLSERLGLVAEDLELQVTQEKSNSYA